MLCARRSGASGMWTTVVGDVDLEKLSNRVNHDVLMGKAYNRIGDWRMLRITQRYLKAGAMAAFSWATVAE